MSPLVKERVPMSSPDLTEAERRAVLEVLSTPVLSMGKQTPAFEESVRKFSGAAHAIAVNSGTSGLHLCVRAAGFGAGDLVITTPFSFIASSNVLLYENAVPIFIDVDINTGNIDPSRLAEAVEQLLKGGKAAEKWLPRKGAIAKKPKGVLAVDVFGQPADYDAITAIATEYDLLLIEDSCEALGAGYKGRQAGRFGQMAVYAFYPNKQITTGEGGVIVTDDATAADFMRALRNQGRAPEDTWLQHTHLGYNYRLPELSAALGRVQMERLNELLAKREQVAAWYTERLKKVEQMEVQHLADTTTRMSWFVYVIRLATQISREKVAHLLMDAGIPTRPYFAPIHLQPFMVERFGYQPGDFPIVEDLGRRGLALPFSSVMTEEQVDLVCNELKKAIPEALEK
ncbi:MAG TPA: DegT/DnrJ/EryC1/StrS family aminotransferase [Anaerolineales bacterium]|nr:DegT/DnrJ/EryC1/StrS family aminotransferase [Anaerolineales bacterium]